MLYILQAERLAASIRNNPNIEGIKLSSKTWECIDTKLNMFDTQLYYKSEEYNEETFETFTTVQKRLRGLNEFGEGCRYVFGQVAKS